MIKPGPVRNQLVEVSGKKRSFLHQLEAQALTLSELHYCTSIFTGSTDS